MKKSSLLLFLGLFFALVSCLKDEIDLDDLSKEVEIERSIAVPLIYGSLDVDDFTDEGWDSLLITDGDTIKLYLIEDLEFSDTLALGDLGQDLVFEYLYLHHGFTNYLPLGLDIRFYLYDSLISQNIDTITLVEPPDTIFLSPAETDENGLVIEELVVEQRDYVDFDPASLDYLQNDATHIIFDAIVPSTGGLVKILDHYTLDFRLGIEAEAIYVTHLDSIN